MQQKAFGIGNSSVMPITSLNNPVQESSSDTDEEQKLISTLNGCQVYQYDLNSLKKKEWLTDKVYKFYHVDYVHFH